MIISRSTHTCICPVCDEHLEYTMYDTRREYDWYEEPEGLRATKWFLTCPICQEEFLVKEVTVDDDDREILNEVTVSNSKNMLLRRQEDILANALSVNSNTSSDGKKEDCVNKEAIMQECCATQSTSEYEEE